MTDVTPNIRLVLPDYDQPGWDTEINDNLRVLDSLVARVISIGGTYLGIYVPGASFILNNVVTDPATSRLWQAGSAFTTANTDTFAQERAAHPTHWTDVTVVTNNAAVSANLAAGSATTASNAATSALAAQVSAIAAQVAAASSAASAAASALNSAPSFKNRIINPRFNTNQFNTVGVGISCTNTSIYMTDGWQLNALGAPTVVGKIVASTDADRTGIGDEGAKYYANLVLTNAAGVNDFSGVNAFLEGVGQIAGKTVVLGFWALGTTKVCVSFTQVFGTGGSPSASVVGIGQAVIQLTSASVWTFYTTPPITIPSIVGKTLGTTTGTDYLRMQLFLSAGTTIGAAQAGSIGSQVGTVNIAQPQLEIGSVNTSFEHRPVAVELLMAQRYYETGFYTKTGYDGAGLNNSNTISFKVTKRITPTAAINSSASSNVTVQSFSSSHPDSGVMSQTITALGHFSDIGSWTADARI